MDKTELLSILRDEITWIAHLLIQTINPDVEEDEFEFTFANEKFIIEPDFQNLTATIDTYHLTKDKAIHNRWNKNLVADAQIFSSIDTGSQVYFWKQGTSKKLIPEVFVESEISSYQKILEDYLK